MAIEKKSKSLSKATKTLLSGGETEYVDFKRTPDGVHADDLVSFANSDHGGEILVGIAEETGEEGSQHGVVYPSLVTDILRPFVVRSKGTEVVSFEMIDLLHAGRLVPLPPLAVSHKDLTSNLEPSLCARQSAA